MIFFVLQGWALLCSAVMITCAGRKSYSVKTFGYIVCLLGQPVWLWHTLIAQQYGFFALSIWYCAVAIYGLIEALRQPKKALESPSTPKGITGQPEALEAAQKPFRRWDGWLMAGDPGDAGTWKWRDSGLPVLPRHIDKVS